MSDLLSGWPCRFLLALRGSSLNTFGRGGVFTERIRNFAEPTDRIPENSRTVRVANTSSRAVDTVFAFALAAAWIFFGLMFFVMLADVFAIVRGG